MTGAYDSTKTVAGTCVESGQIGSLTSAILVWYIPAFFVDVSKLTDCGRFQQG